MPINRFLPIFLLSGLLAGALKANESAKWIEANSDSRRITVQSVNDSVTSSMLGVAQDLQDQLQADYAIVVSPNSRLILRVESWDYQVTNTKPAIQAWSDGKQATFQMTIYQRPRAGVEELFRSLVAVSLYQSVYQDGKIQGGTLMDLPLWLHEGLLQGLLAGHSETNSAIIDRAKQQQKTPSLATIFSWQELSDDRVECCWQQAFCWAAWQFAFAHKDLLTALKSWLSDRAQNHAATDGPWKVDEVLEKKWQRYQAEEVISHDALFYPWERSLTEVKESRTLQLPANPNHPKEQPAVKVPFSALYENRAHYGFQNALANKLADLAVLQARVHFSLRTVLEAHILALSSLGVSPELQQSYRQQIQTMSPQNKQDSPSDSKQSSTLPVGSKGEKSGEDWTAEELKNPDARFAKEKTRLTEGQYKAMVAEADRKLAELIAYKQGVEDYLNWFEVTQRAPMMESSFEDYFQLSDKLDGFLHQHQAAVEGDLSKIEKKL